MKNEHIVYAYAPNKELIHPTLIMVKTWPRIWTFVCGGCAEKVSVFGWWGFARCPYCRQRHGMKWEFPGSGF